MAYAALYLPPGMVLNGTPAQALGRWREGNFIRWKEGIMSPVGGWKRITETPRAGRVSAIFTFLDNVDRSHIAQGTNEAAYVTRNDGEYVITPEDFTPGAEFVTAGEGYGAGEYNADEYGTPRGADNTGLVTLPTQWEFASWGQMLLGLASSDGRLFYWSPGDLTTPPDDTFIPVPNAPENNASVLVANERHILLIGAGGEPRKVAWCSREDFSDWTPKATNTAGDLTLELSGPLVQGYKVGSEILLLSLDEAFVLDFIGSPLQYGSRQVGASCGVVGSKAGVSALDFAAWMGRDGFFTYNGQVAPLPCSVWDYVFRDINQSQLPLVTCGHNGEYREIWWFFPKGTAKQNTHYVSWNYQANVWSAGELQRSAWADRSSWKAVLAAGADSHLYEHELALSTPGLEPREKPYVVSAPFELQTGDVVTSVVNIIPDRDNQALDALSYYFTAKPNPRVDGKQFGPYYPDADGYTNVRFSGREITMKVEAVQDNDWRLGRLRADIRPGGRR